MRCINRALSRPSQSQQRDRFGVLADKDYARPGIRLLVGLAVVQRDERRPSRTVMSVPSAA